MTSDVTGEEGEPTLPTAGSIVASKYELVRVIGKGGMGVVYEAKHLRLNKHVAIKMLKPAALHLSEFRPRFEREARTAALLRGRHVARIFDVDATEDGLPFMVMEYLVGRDLDAELHERGTLSVQEATGYVLQACVAMQEAHAAGIIHRDLKPANLFLTDEGGERIVKVLDFGISKLTSEVDTHLTATFATVGTPLYMSPEQVRSSRTVDARSDIWSLAVILFEALAGHPPFHGSMTATAAAIVADKTPSLCALRPDIPPEFESALAKALEKHPNRRYQDVQALSAALAPFGPPRMPSTGLSDPSIPSFPSGPSSNPLLSSSPRNPPFSSGPELPEVNEASETVLIPPEERGGSAGDVRGDKPQRLGAILAGAGVIAIILVAGTVAALRRPPPQAAAGAGSRSEATAITASASPESASPHATEKPSAAPAPSATLSAAPAPSSPPAVASSAAPHPSPSLLSTPSAPSPGYSATVHPTASVPRRPTPPTATARPPPPPANPIFLQ